MTDQLIAITLIIVIVNAIIAFASAIATIAQSGVLSRDLRKLKTTVATSADIDEINRRIESLDNESEQIHLKIVNLHQQLIPIQYIDDPDFNLAEQIVDRLHSLNNPLHPTDAE